MRKIKITETLLIGLSVFAISFTNSGLALAQSADKPSSRIDFTENDIQTYDPTDSIEPCNSGSTGGGAPVAGFSPDPAALKVYNDTIKPKMARLAPLYQKAAAAENFADWELLAGIHYVEYASATRNPTTNTGFRGVFQMSYRTLSGAGFHPDQSPFIPGEELTDDMIVTQARAAISVFLKPKARYLKVDTSKPMSVEDALKLSIAYKSGEGSSWIKGTSDKNLHAYSWTGYDTTPEHKMPMRWGSGSPYGDEVAGSLFSRPGTLMIWGVLKGGDISSVISADCTTDSSSGSAQAISGDRAELVKRILGNNKLKLGNYGNASTQKSDIQTELTLTTLQLLTAMLEQSGVKSIPVNALKTDHGGGSLHALGRAIDVGYFGNGSKCESQRGSACNDAEGNKLYSFLYNNYKQLKISELIWQDPPPGLKCIGKNGPVDCYAYYGDSTMNIHYHHIHTGVSQ